MKYFILALKSGTILMEDQTQGSSCFVRDLDLNITNKKSPQC